MGKTETTKKSHDGMIISRDVITPKGAAFKVVRVNVSRDVQEKLAVKVPLGGTPQKAPPKS